MHPVPESAWTHGFSFLPKPNADATFRLSLINPNTGAFTSLLEEVAIHAEMQMIKEEKNQSLK